MLSRLTWFPLLVGSMAVCCQGGRMTDGGGRMRMALDGARGENTSPVAEVPVQIDLGAWQAPTPWPLGMGVPLPRGAVQSVDQLLLRTAGTKVIPAQAHARAFWPDGSIQWAWIDFSGLWSLDPGEVAFVRFEDLAPVVAFGDPARFFLPSAASAVGPEPEWTAPTADGLVPGRFGNGLHLESLHAAHWDTEPQASSFPFSKGTLEFWWRPDWTSYWLSTQGVRSLITARPLYLGYRYQPDKRASGYFLVGLQFHPFWEDAPWGGDPWLVRVEAYEEFLAGEWNHLAVTWSRTPQIYRIFRNGKLAGELTADVEERPAEAMLALGPLAGTYDELRLSDTIRYDGEFVPSAEPFADDGSDVLLFHFDDDLAAEGSASGVVFSKARRLQAGQLAGGTSLSARDVVQVNRSSRE